ncbi:MAG: AraC-like DNA-binding protein/mannose-6-phosphate isomerase-like protein (cupin superfamily) [Verrucomicrobiales bacterium]|jgi:AraC-like DNA-binding protein/mannose-6-phosphate isomerase-like protein (cupin superfamily)
MSAVLSNPQGRENQVDSIDGWPLLYKEFELSHDLELTPREQPEIFIVLSGTFLHEYGQSLQSMRAGSVIVSHPGQTHFARQPTDVRLIRLRFLPEWMVNDIHMILDSPDLLSLFFARILFDFPVENPISVVSLKREPFEYVSADLSVLKDQLQQEQIDETLTRLTMLKIFLHISEEYGFYWRRRNRIALRPEIMHAMRAIEGGINFSGAVRLSTLEPLMGMSLDHLGRLFKKATGTTLVDYTQRRRVQHAARQLLFTDKTATAIAQDLHFTDSAHFTKSFQRYFRRSPNEYRSHFAFNPAWLRL